MALATNLETGLRNAVNAGIGVYKLAQEKLAEVQTQLNQGYSSLVSRGAADQSADVAKLRSLLDQGLTAVKDGQGKLEGLLKK
jgi:hypothetical protein